MNNSEGKPYSASLEELFDAASTLRGNERDSYIDRHCGTDSGLRSRLKALLRAHDAAGGFLPEEPSKSVELTSFLTEKAGDRIGRYKLLQPIGEGGCGVVYMAEQQEPVRRLVALKVIKLGMDTRSVIARFEAERQALALMEHPNIAKVLDAGTTEIGRPYFVMELVRGVKITDYCDQARSTSKDRLELFIKVCQAVQHAHQKGIIHRDLKPSNILVTINDGVAVPKVIDFGIAKATEGRLTDKTLFTSFEQFIGTPAYMSPEQAVLTSLDVDTRSDIYSLGVLLYELLVGETPFDTNKLMQSGIDEMRRAIRETEPSKPSTRVRTLEGAKATTLAEKRQIKLPALVGALTGDLDWIVMKALEKDRSRRYPTSLELAADVQRHLDNEPVSAGAPSQLHRIRKLTQRHKGLFVGVTAVISALILGLSLTAWQMVRANREAAGARKAEAVAASETRRANKESIAAQEARDDAETRLAKLKVIEGWRRVEEGDSFGALRLFTDALERDQIQTNLVEIHRLRLSSVLQHCPKLVDVWSLGTNLHSAEFNPNGSKLVTCSQAVSGPPVLSIWDTETGQLLTVPQRYGGSPTTIVWSGDGKRFLTFNKSYLRVWNGITGDPASPWMTPETVGEVDFSFDGTRVAISWEAFLTITMDATPTRTEYHPTVEVWDSIAGKPLWKLPKGGSEPVRLIQDAKTVLVGTRLFDSGDGKARESHLMDPSSMIVSSPDGSLVLVVDNRWKARIHESAHMEASIKEFDPLSRPVSVLFSPDNSQVALACEDGTVVLWDVEGTGQGLPLSMHMRPIHSMKFSPDSSLIATVGEDSAARVWDVHTKLPVTPILPHSGSVQALSFSADGNRLLIAGADANLVVWDLRCGALPRFTWAEGKLNNSVTFSPDGKLLAGNTSQTGINIWSLVSGDMSTPILDGSPYSLYRFTSDNHRLYEAAGPSATCWEVSSGHRLTPKSLDQHDGFNGEFLSTMTANGKYVIRGISDRCSCETNNIVDIKDARGVKIATLSLDSSSSALVVTPDARFALVRLGNSNVVWSLATTQVTAHLPSALRDSFHFKPDIRAIPGTDWMFWSRSHATELWNVITGERDFQFTHAGAQFKRRHFDFHSALNSDATKVISVLRERAWVVSTNGTPLISPIVHGGLINSAVFNANGRFIATASADKTMRVWDASTGEAITPRFQHGGSVNGVEFCPNDNGLASWDDECIRYWELRADPRPLADWRALAEFFASADTSFTATRDANSTKPFRERWLELRQKYPSDFTMSPSEVDAWERIRTARAETKQDWSNAVTYITALMEKHPDSADFPLRRAAAYVAWAESLIAHELRSTANITNLLQLALADYDHTLVWSERFPESIKETRELLLWSRIQVLRKLHRHKEAQKDWLEVNAIPPRPAKTDPRLIDLSQWFNWADGSPFEAAIVRKLQTGTEFDVRSSVWLASDAANSSEYPEKVMGIPIKQICHRIHFLHAADTTNPIEGVSVSKFIIHLANGTKDTIEIKIGLDVWGGYGLTKEQTRPTRNSVMAWSGQIQQYGQEPQILQLYQNSWQNPFPDIPVVSVDFESSMHGVQPGLYGITLDP